jgi:hypothetical protein
MTVQSKDIIEKQICGLMSIPMFNMDEKDYNTFLQLVSDMSFEAETPEMALAFITVAVMDKDKLIIERNNREEDFKTLINIIVYLYRHVDEPKSTLLLLTEALELYIPGSESNFRSAILVGKTYFEDVVDLVRKPIQPQPQFYYQ